MSPEAEKILDNEDKKNLLNQALMMVESGMDLQDRYLAGSKYVSYLKTVVNGAEKALGCLQVISKSALLLSQKFAINAILSLDKNDTILKSEFEKIVSIIEKQLQEFENLNNTESEMNMSQLCEKIKNLESRRRFSDTTVVHASSSKTLKCEVDEKYPENLSRDSLIDLNNIPNLPTVPEDIFTSFSNSNNPKRSSSLSSLKSMRKIKLFLQKAENSDDEISDSDEFAKQLVYVNF